MERRILRYELKLPPSTQQVSMVEGRVIAVGIKRSMPGRIQVWIEGSLDEAGLLATPFVQRSFAVVATGAEVPEGEYRGTVITPVDEVYHVYELG